MPIRYTIRDQFARIGDPATTTYPFAARCAYHPNGTVSETEFPSADSPATAKRYKYAVAAASHQNPLKNADFSSWSGTAWTGTLAHDLGNICRAT